MHERPTTPQPASPIVPGIILVASALAAILAVSHHPVVKAHTAADAMRQIADVAVADRAVHGALIAVMILLLYAFAAFAQRRDVRRPLNLLALVAYTTGAAAFIGAALVDGFFIPEIGRHFAAPSDLAAGVTLLKLCAIGIQVFTKLGIIAMGFAALSWSADLLGGMAAQRVTAIVGFTAVAVQAAVLTFGGSAITAHTILIIIAAQACWYVALGVLLIRNDV